MDTQIENLPTVGFIYRLIVGDNWYIGSTYENTQRRMDAHYKQGKLTPERKLYKAVSECGGWKAVRFEIVTTFPFTTKEEMWQQENTYIRLDDPKCLNTNRAILTPEERVEQKREVSSRCKKALYLKRKDDPDWIEKERERARILYAKQKEDPEFMARKRASAVVSYHKRKSNSH